MSGNKSKPVYAPLQADTGGHYHLMVGTTEGTSALLRVIGELQNEAPGSLGRTRVLLTGTPGALQAEATDPVGEFQGLGLQDVQSFDAPAALLAELRMTLQRSLMGTRLYIAGPESFIGRVLQIGLSFNMNKDEIRAEERGTAARRVHCVHCRSATEDVRTNIIRCNGCARWLTVRDHYSRRLAAYMGVMVDAEAPGDLPQIKEVFS